MQEIRTVAEDILDNVKFIIVNGLCRAFNRAQELLRKENNDHKKYIILLTDGKPYGSEGNALNASKELDKNNITMYSIGFAKDQDFSFLEKCPRAQVAMQLRSDWKLYYYI